MGLSTVVVLSDANGIAAAPLPIRPIGSFIEEATEPFGIFANISASISESGGISIYFIEAINAYRFACPPINPAAQSVFAALISLNPLTVQAEYFFAPNTQRTALKKASNVFIIVDGKLVNYVESNVIGELIVTDPIPINANSLIVRTKQRSCFFDAGATNPVLLDAPTPVKVNTLDAHTPFLIGFLLIAAAAFFRKFHEW
jgi:hypothetical protein